MRRARQPVASMLAGLLLAGLPAGLFPGSALADPRIDYMIHCQGCHLPELQGSPGIVPGLCGDVGRIAGVPGGRDYLMRVPGAAQAPLGDAALAGVLNWIIATCNADTRPAGFVAFDAREVGAARRAPLDHPEVTRAQVFAPPRY